MENQPSQKRQIAFKRKIKDILEGSYHQQEGWNPNYLLTQDNKKISRVNVIAVIVGQVQDQTQNLVLDDGSGQINLRLFEASPKDVQVGDTILTIARIREFNSQRYLVPEIIKIIKNSKWVEVRKLELGPAESPLATAPEKEKLKEETPLAPYENILNLIKKIDQGDGADVEEIIKQSTISDCEELIDNLLKEGDIFEISPGKVKILK